MVYTKELFKYYAAIVLALAETNIGPLGLGVCKLLVLR